MKVGGRLREREETNRDRENKKAYVEKKTDKERERKKQNETM